MAQTHRVQITIEPEEYRQLESFANQKGTSVEEFVRTAVRERYWTRLTRRRESCRRSSDSKPH
jgi:hypothetical protein